jgi:hypothetical protein
MTLPGSGRTCARQYARHYSKPVRLLKRCWLPPHNLSSRQS